MTKEKKHLVIIDANSILHRAYHALPPLTTKKGELINAVYGFLLVFLKVIREFQPDFIAACFDFPAPTFRHEKYKEYKITRPPTPKELYQQIPQIKEILKAFGVSIFEKEKFEADDLIGTIATIISQNQILAGIETIILSGDFDVLQLIDSQTKVYTLKKGVKDIVLYDETEFKKKYEFSPQQLLDFKALKGDPSDNIPGVKGIGEKTAKGLLIKFGSLENLYEEIEKLSDKAQILKPKLRNLLLESKEKAFLNKILVTLRKDVPIEFTLDKCSFGEYDKEEILDILKKWGFNSLIDRLSKPEQSVQEKVKNNPKDSMQRKLRLW